MRQYQAGHSASVQEPYQEKTIICTTMLDGGSQRTIVAAPGINARIVVTFIHVGLEGQVNTVEFRDGNTRQVRLYLAAAGDHEERYFKDEGGWRLSENAALTIYCSAGTQINYEVHYWIENV